MILGLDISTKTIGVALFEDLGTKGKLRMLTHVSPKVKPKPEYKIQELIEKANIFRDEFLIEKLNGFEIDRVIIEEPLLRSNNVNTVGTLLRFNGMVAKDVYEVLGVVPEFISSYDARANAFPELMEIRTHNKKGERYSEKVIERKIKKGERVLFGGYPWDVDKKEVIYQKVDDLEPQVEWLYSSRKEKGEVVVRFKKENYDMCDAYACVRGVMKRDGKWVD